MQDDPQTASDLVIKFGGTHGLASVLSVTVQAICNMRTRGAFPPRHWPVLIREAEKREIQGVTLDWLASLGTASDDADTTADELNERQQEAAA